MNYLFILGLDSFLHDYADDQLQGLISDGLDYDYLVPRFSEWKRSSVHMVNSLAETMQQLQLNKVLISLVNNDFSNTWFFLKEDQI